MTEPTVARPDIDPVLKMLLDTFPVTFTAADGVEVARARLRQLKTPPELLPELRIEERTVGYDGLTDIPVRVYWPPVVRDNLPVVVYYHGGGWSLGGLDTHDPVARAHAVGAQAIVRVEVAHDESAAMEIQHNGRLGLIGTRWRPIDPGPDRPRRSIDRKVNDPQLGVHRLAR